MAGSINLGVRHILPGYVFLFPAAGAAAEAFAGRRGAFRILLGALLLFQVSVAARAFPDYIPYFNEAAGGPDAGGRYLADSNLDWGQNLLSLKHWMGENGVEEVLLKEATPGAPDAYGLRTLVPFRARPSTENPVHLALGETMRLRMTLGAPGGDEKAAFLDRQEIVARIGHAMRVYRVTEPFPREFFHLRGRKPEEPDEPDPTF